jgi:hypothetical protein
VRTLESEIKESAKDLFSSGYDERAYVEQVWT